MIQRIQSIFLLLAALFPLGMLALPFASSEKAEADTIFSDQVFNLSDNISLPILFGLGAVIALAAIFLYSNRPFQMRVALLSFVANLVGLILVIVFFTQSGVSNAQIGVGVAFPLVAMLLVLVARSYIKKDDKLVKSMDRLR